jgi:uncharacterized protein (TIGR00725 family)
MIQIAVTGSVDTEDAFPLIALSKALGSALVSNRTILLVGELMGTPGQVARTVYERGGLVVALSAANSLEEQNESLDAWDPISNVNIFTGCGHKARNVLLIRSADIVIIMGGRMGTLNEFTIAYDEGKIIGVLKGSQGFTEEIIALTKKCKKPTKSVIHVDPDPARLLARCIQSFDSKPPGFHHV